MIRVTPKSQQAELRPSYAVGGVGTESRSPFWNGPRPCLPRSRNNLSQWEKVIRGEESALGILDTPEAQESSEKLPVKTDDWGPQRAVPPGDAHPASLTFLPFIFGGNLHLLTGVQTSSRRTTKWTRPADGSLPRPRRWSARPGDALPRDASWLVTWPFLTGC